MLIMEKAAHLKNFIVMTFTTQLISIMFIYMHKKVELGFTVKKILISIIKGE